jgi:hypothetical protein
MDIQAQEAFKTPNKNDRKRTSQCHIVVKMPRVQTTDRMLEAVRKKLLTKTNLSK